MAEAVVEEVRSSVQEGAPRNDRADHHEVRPAHGERPGQLLVGTPEEKDTEDTLIDHDAADTQEINLGLLHAQLQAEDEAMRAEGITRTEGVPSIQYLKEQSTRRHATQEDIRYATPEGSDPPNVHYNQYDESNLIGPDSPLLRRVEDTSPLSRLRRLGHMLNVPRQIREGVRNRAARRERDRLTDPAQIQPGEGSERLLAPQDAQRITDALESGPVEQEIAEAAREYRWSKGWRRALMRATEYFAQADAGSTEVPENASDGFTRATFNDDALAGMREEPGLLYAERVPDQHQSSIEINAHSAPYMHEGKDFDGYGRSIIGWLVIPESKDVWVVAPRHPGDDATGDTFDLVRVDPRTGQLDESSTVTINSGNEAVAENKQIEYNTANGPVQVNARIENGSIHFGTGEKTSMFLIGNRGLRENITTPQAA